MGKFIKKSDIILIIILLILGIATEFYLAQTKSNGTDVVIEKDGKVYGTYSLYENKEILVGKRTKDSSGKNNHWNIVQINNGKVKMESASCQNQVCVHHSEISSEGESIVCLPNKLVVYIKGKGGKYDSISS